MTSTLNKISRTSLGILAVLCSFLFTQPVAAQESLSLSVTPPLFQLSAVPGQSWQSSVKIINTNSYPITVYADPVNFAPIGEEGHGRFLPIFEEETKGQTLAVWIDVTRKPIVVDPETIQDIPFSVVIPKEPPPGGHFAALLVGTRPPDSKEMVVSTAQMVSSLIFLRISGEVIESGRIREFSIEDAFVEKPEAEFQLRFENNGNVHLRPQGDIVIYNMWGKERGVIPINQTSSFGNVLPSTTRKFNFSWKGEYSLTDMGRYKAVVTLTYGDEKRQNLNQSVYFWVIPLKAALGSLFVLVVLISLVRWAIKSYVRHMLHMAGIDPDEHARRKRAGDVAMFKKLRQRSLDEQPIESDKAGFLRRHLALLVGIPAIMLLIGALLWYLSGALTDKRGYEVILDTGGSSETINSEELRLRELSSESADSTGTEKDYSDQGFILRVVNVSGAPGAAAELAVTLEKEGFLVDSVKPDLEREQNRTAVVSTVDGVIPAKKISALINNALVSVVESEEQTDLPEITVFAGKDLVKK